MLPAETKNEHRLFQNLQFPTQHQQPSNQDQINCYRWSPSASSVKSTNLSPKVRNTTKLSSWNLLDYIYIYYIYIKKKASCLLSPSLGPKAGHELLWTFSGQVVGTNLKALKIMKHHGTKTYLQNLIGQCHLQSPRFD